MVWTKSFTLLHTTFSRENINRPNWDTFQLHGKTKSWLLSTQNGLVSSTHVHTSNRWRHRPNWYTFQLHDLLVKSTNFDPAKQKKFRFHFARNYASFISREKNRPKWETFRLHGKTKSWLLSTLYVFFIFPKEPKRASFLLRWRHRPNWYTFPLHDLLAKLTNFDPANKKKFKFDSARKKIPQFSPWKIFFSSRELEKNIHKSSPSGIRDHLYSVGSLHKHFFWQNLSFSPVCKVYCFPSICQNIFFPFLLYDESRLCAAAFDLEVKLSESRKVISPLHH